MKTDLNDAEVHEECEWKGYHDQQIRDDNQEVRTEVIRLLNLKTKLIVATSLACLLCFDIVRTEFRHSEIIARQINRGLTGKETE